MRVSEVQLRVAYEHINVNGRWQTSYNGFGGDLPTAHLNARKWIGERRDRADHRNMHIEIRPILEWVRADEEDVALAERDIEWVRAGEVRPLITVVIDGINYDITRKEDDEDLDDD
jgi:hypothetical protein